MHISKSTLLSDRNDALNELAEMYSFLADVKDKEENSGQVKQKDTTGYLSPAVSFCCDHTRFDIRDSMILSRESVLVR